MTILPKLLSLFFPTSLLLGQTGANSEMLRMQGIDASSCAHLYPDIGSFVVGFVTEAKGSQTNVVSKQLFIFTFPS